MRELTKVFEKGSLTCARLAGEKNVAVGRVDKLRGSRENIFHAAKLHRIFFSVR